MFARIVVLVRHRMETQRLSGDNFITHIEREAHEYSRLHTRQRI